MADRIDIVLAATSNLFTRAKDEVQHGLKELSGTASEVGESLKGRFEGLGNLFSSSGVEGAISGLGGSLTSLGGSAAEALAGLGPVGIAVGALVAAATAGAAAVIGLGLGIKSIIEPETEAISKSFYLAESLRGHGRARGHREGSVSIWNQC